MIRSDFGPLVVEKVGKHNWRVVQEWVTPFGTVPVDFVSDGASIPRLLWWFSHPAAEFFEASVFHDYCYKTALKSKAFADRSFCEIGLAYGASKRKTKLASLAVKWFGRGAY